MTHPEHLIDGYFRYYEAKNAEDFWAVEYVDRLVQKNPEEAWELTCLLIDKSKSDDVLAITAAGPLEMLLYQQGPALIERVEKECRTNDRLRLALSGVWGIRPGNPIYERW